MRNTILLIFLVIFTIKLDLINCEPLLIRKHNYVSPFSRPAHLSPINPTFEPLFDQPLDDMNLDFLNNVSLGQLLKDDQTLIDQSEQMSGQIRYHIASKLIGLANRLQHAAGILLEGGISRRPIPHRSRPIRPGNPRKPGLDEIPPPLPTRSPLSESSVEQAFASVEPSKANETSNSLPKRTKRDLESFDKFGRVSKQQLTDVSNEVKTGYNNVIKLLKKYLDDPPITDRQNLKRSTERAEQLLENIEGAKKIFTQIEDYVSRQYLENDLERRNQTDLISYYDKIIRVEKNRIGQALNEYDTQLASNYKPVDYEPSTNNRRPSVPEYQNDEDHDRYLTSRRERERQLEREREKEIERENRRTPIRSYYNEIPEEEKLINGRNQRQERPKILIRTYYEPPKRNSRPTRKHSNERIRPPYEVSVPVSNSRGPFDEEDERGYEMIEP